MGAAAREMLVKAASSRWGVDAASCRTERGRVLHDPTKRVLTYGELAEEAAKLDIPKAPKLKDPTDFKILGKASKRPDVPLKTCGKAEFGIDVRLPDMLYAVVERCPVVGGTLKRFDARAALALNVAGVETAAGPHTVRTIPCPPTVSQRDRAN